MIDPRRIAERPETATLTLRYVQFTQLPHEVWDDGRLIAAFAIGPDCEEYFRNELRKMEPGE